MRTALVRFLALSVVGAALGCERTPPEDFPGRVPVAAPPLVVAANAASGSAPEPAAATHAGVPLPGRCILPTPPIAPPAVAPGPAPGCPHDPEDPGEPPIPVRVAFPQTPGVSVEAEVVRSPHDTARGLMYRTSLPESRGMLFDLRTRDDHKFWMHNTCIPLDLLYIDEDGVIVGIVENAPTLNDESRGVGCPSFYVLEVNAGWTRRHGVKAGQRVALPGEPRGN